jgi:hypothetical protein
MFLSKCGLLGKLQQEIKFVDRVQESCHGKVYFPSHFPGNGMKTKTIKTICFLSGFLLLLSENFR